MSSTAMAIVGVMWLVGGTVGLFAYRRYPEEWPAAKSRLGRAFERLYCRLRMPSPTYYKRVNLLVTIGFFIGGIAFLIAAAVP
jgi:hypothetical protein